MPLSALFSSEQLEGWKSTKVCNDYQSYQFLNLMISMAYNYYSNNYFDSDRNGYILAFKLLNSLDITEAKEIILDMIKDYKIYEQNSEELDKYYAALKFVQEPGYFEQFKYIFELVERFNNDKSFCDNYHEYLNLQQKVSDCEENLSYLNKCYHGDSDSMERDYPEDIKNYDNAVNTARKFLIEKMIF